MPSDTRLLFAQLSVRLEEIPSRSLMDLSREFQVSSRTIQHSIAMMTGRKFSDFKDDLLIARLTRLFLAKPLSPIKDVSFELGYKSNRTFARAVRRACGHSPAEFRERVIGEAAAQKKARVPVPRAVNH
jgi:AraC-like DNA-binding protein